ncbi:biotin carboxylase N-terminal domain-containing protein [Gordonia jinhuaensis]|uniref:biotin carboxylase n=1 Tax=Gordonia jinhuaensis TaxID=1517702 RepID=A0A916TIL0_9ACTN|nr:biotin carboxylase N-terminal domain-containing protein [Gordonia jinhuaensis]GGB46811.1 acetyl/propionyl-CoA carboxylase subuit alpha [Gordonia jinhuaensis]
MTTQELSSETPVVTDFSRVLVANRGEIARRVFAAARELGLSTVAVYSDPDASAPFVGEADAAVRLAGETATDTYLDAEAIISAARRAGADAIHPGYGFLSENASFAEKVIDAGLVWIGPSPKAIREMGAKVNAKAVMAAAGVPVLTDVDPESVTEADLPLLIKASSGGGGRGMRIVETLDELSGQLESARHEAQSAFGDPTVFIEPYVARGHHIEVQILADAHGSVAAVGERECSIQRRHQKVVEEAPSPLVERLGGDMRERLFAAARAAASAIDYRGAGTVEFLADDNGRFFFLEMNTRLQVEHPVTEAVSGVDLVQWQLRIARGEELVALPEPAGGSSIEVRLYAEDPANDFSPQFGTVHHVRVPAARADAPIALFHRRTDPGIRVDGAIEDGTEVSTFYDPMLAKIISWAPDRRASAAILAAALQSMRLHGPVTNRDMLINTVRHRLFVDGQTTTAFIDEVGLDELSAPVLAGEYRRASVVAAALAAAHRGRGQAKVQRGIPSGWRNLPSGYQSKRFVENNSGAQEYEVRYRFTRDGSVELPDDDLTVVSVADDLVIIESDGVATRYEVSTYRGEAYYVDSPQGSIALIRPPRFVDPSASMPAGSLVAPMPGVVIRVAVAVGDQVRAGAPLMAIEAMKMEHTITATADGVVTEVAVRQGQQLSPGDVLVVISDDPGAAGTGSKED